MNNNKKGKKLVLFLILFLFIVLITTYFIYNYYVKNASEKFLKNELMTNISNNDFLFFTEDNLSDTISKKIDNQNYETSNKINLNTTMKNNIFSNLDLSKIELNYDTKNLNLDKKNYRKLSLKYADNDLVSFDFIKTENQFAIKSDEIVNRYVGISNKNLQSVVNKVKGTNVDLLDFKKAKNFIIDREKIDLSKIQNTLDFQKYSEIIQSDILSENISKKDNVIISMNRGQVNTSEYTINLDNSKFNKLLQDLLLQIQSDNKVFAELVVSNVQDFEDEDTVLLEYNDNDNASEVKANSVNYNTSVTINNGESENIENETTINQVETNTIIENTTNENNEANDTQNEINQTNTITNNTTENNTVSNVISNTISNTTNNAVSENTVSENTVSENTVSQNTVSNETTAENTITETEQQTSENVQNISTVENVVTIQEQIEQVPSDPVVETSPAEQPNPNPEPEIIEEDNFRTKGFIMINQDSEGISQNDNFIIGDNYKETLENISKLIENLDWKSYIITGAKANITKEELLKNVENSILNRINQNNSLAVKFYINEGKLVKINFEIIETLETLDIEIDSIGENEKYLNIKIMKGQENNLNGYSVNLYKKISDTILTNKININKINKNKIIQKVDINTQTKGTINSKKYIKNMILSYSDSEGEFKIDIDSSLNFDVNFEINDLTEENCLFLDNLSDEELIANVDAIKQKTIDVLNDKNKNLNIIDLNNSNQIVKQTENNQSTNIDLQAKEEAKQVLIQTISIKMRQYLDEGNNLTIQDLEGLEIPGYQVNISISSNLAIITVNGYRFKIDSEFNLSDS